MAVITSTVTGGNWSRTSTWVGRKVPKIIDDVVIATKYGYKVIYDLEIMIEGACKSVTINSGATLEIPKLPVYGLFRMRLDALGDLCKGISIKCSKGHSVYNNTTQKQLEKFNTSTLSLITSYIALEKVN